MPNLTAKISELNSVSLKTIGEENETSFEFNVVVYENNRKLNDGEFSIEFADVDEKIISIENNKVFAVGKGSETISAVITSLLTSDSITVELPVSVILVNQDKTSTIQLDKIAWDDESSPLALTDVFSDVDEQILSNCTIISIVDITGVECEIPYVNGEVDVEFLQNSSILGDRVWRVECEKFSYDVRVYIEKINTDALVASMAGTYKPVAYGNYSYASWETIVIGATGTIKGYGNAAHTLKVEPIDSNYGTFKDASRSEIVNGYYMKDGENFNLFVYSTDNSYRHTVQFVKQGVTAIDENAIYAKLAGTYSDGQKTTINLTNNNVSVSEKSSQAGNAKTCSGQVGGYKISGVAYDVIPTSATTGIITFISANGGFKENYSAIYTIDGDTVKLVVKYGDGIEMTKS